MFRMYLMDGGRVLPWRPFQDHAFCTYYLSRDEAGRWERGEVLSDGQLLPRDGWSWAEEEPRTHLCSQCGSAEKDPEGDGFCSWCLMANSDVSF